MGEWSRIGMVSKVENEVGSKVKSGVGNGVGNGVEEWQVEFRMGYGRGGSLGRPFRARGLIVSEPRALP